MPVLDERGRLFGRINLIDAIVGVVVVGLIPLAYGAFLVFRPPQPTIDSITPAQVFERQQATLHIAGKDLRPFLTIKIGNQAEFGFLVAKPTEGELIVYNLPAGIYDIQLMDRGQLLVRKPNALTVLALNEEANAIAPTVSTPASRVVSLQAIGRFVGLTKDTAGAVHMGSKFDLAPANQKRPPSIEVVSARALEPAIKRVSTGAGRSLLVPLVGEYQLPAAIRLRCVVGDAECKVGETSIIQNTVLTLAPRDGAAGEGAKAPETIQFIIEDVRVRDGSRLPTNGERAWATLRVRFVASPELYEQLHAGDQDVPGDGAYSDEERAVLTVVGTDRQPTSSSVSTMRAQIPVEMVAFTATVRMPVSFLGPGPSSSAGWMYKGSRDIRIGATFPFETLSGYMIGSVLSMRIHDSRDQPIAY